MPDECRFNGNAYLENLLNLFLLRFYGNSEKPLLRLGVAHLWLFIISSHKCAVSPEWCDR